MCGLGLAISLGANSECCAQQCVCLDTHHTTILCSTGVAEIGVSYEKLAQSMTPGRTIKMADGGLSIKVLEVLDSKRVKGV